MKPVDAILMRGHFLFAAFLIASSAVFAQESASYKLAEHVFNAGGHPENGTVLSSSSFKITLDSIGEGLASGPLSSASHSIGGGFGAPYPPPGEVTNLMFADEDTLEWDPEKSVGVYNLYRGLISNVAGLGFGACEQQDITDTSTDDTDAVPAEDGFFYLVTAENLLAEDGTKGSQSDGTERQGSVCP